MNEPQRLRDSEGAARILLGGAELEVPSAARRRAIAFSGAAASMVASGTASAAGGASLVKGVVLWLCIGTAGGGLLSLAVAQTISHLEAAPTQTTQVHPAPQAARRVHAAPRPGSATPAANVDLATPATTAAPSDARAGQPSLAARAPSSVAVDAKPPSEPSLFDEQRVIEQARSAIAHGDTSFALATLDGYDQSYPRGQFGPEALALRVEALSAQGSLEQARSLAHLFERRYPHHPLLSRVQATVTR